MAATNKFIVHVGYGKTATTWLQERIFRRLGRDVYLGKTEDHYPRWLIDAAYLDDYAYRKRLGELRKQIASLGRGRRRALVSSEAFTNLGVVHTMARRVREVFGECRVVLVLRNPLDWFVSNYKYCVEHEGFALPLEKYLDFGEKRTPFALEKRPPFYVPDFFYDEVAETYRRLFGADRICILRYEDFRSAPKTFGERLAAFMGLALPDFARESRRVVLKSGDDRTVERKRLENLRRFIQRASYRDGFGRKGGGGAAGPRVRPCLSAAMRQRLMAALADRCGEFYPDLAQPGTHGQRLS